MKSKEIDSAVDIRKNEIKAGDRVAYVTCLWDPVLSTGTITKIYDSNPEGNNDYSYYWRVKATIRDDNGRLSPNIQCRRIIRL